MVGTAGLLIPVIHPGRYLREILDELSQAEVARSIDVAPCGSRACSRCSSSDREFALLLGRAFGQSPRYWLNLQAAYDPKVAREALGTRLEQVEALLDGRGEMTENVTPH